MKRKRGAMAGFLAAVFLWTAAFSCSGSAVHKATLASRDFRLALQAFQDGEIAWHDSGKVPDDTHRAIQSYIVDAANITKQVNAQLGAGNAASATQLVSQLLTSTDVLLNDGALHIKDKTTLASFEAGIQGIKTVITNVQIYLGGVTNAS